MRIKTHRANDEAKSEKLDNDLDALMDKYDDEEKKPKEAAKPKK